MDPGTALAIMAISSAIGAGASIASSAGAFGGGKEPEAQPLPAMPDQAAIEAEAKKEALRRRAAATTREKTILTSGQGVGEEAAVTRKTLLGE